MIAEFIYCYILRPWPLRNITNWIIKKLLPNKVKIGKYFLFLNPYDPVVSGAIFFNVYEKNPLAMKTVTFNIPWPSDFYINFQYFGSTIFAFIIGVILSFSSMVLTNYKSNNLHYFLGLSIISSFSFPDYNLSLVLSPFFLQVFILIILLKFLTLFIKK